MSFFEQTVKNINKAIVEGFNLTVPLFHILKLEETPKKRQIQTLNQNTIYLGIINFDEKFFLEDNEIGDLRWEKENPPVPIEENASYRRIGVIQDENSYYHAIAKCLSSCYQKGSLVFRKKFANKLKIHSANINLEKYFNINICVLNSPIRIKKNRKSIVLISLPDNKWEIIGKVIEKRSPNGDLIREINFILNEQEDLIQKIVLR